MTDLNERLNNLAALRVSDDAKPLSTDVGNKKPNDKPKPQLSFWPDDIAAMPTDFTRAALFSLIQRGRRRFLHHEKLPSRSDIDLTYFGEQLDHADADLWLAMLRIAKGKSLEEKHGISIAALLRELGKKDGGTNRAWLIKALARIGTASLRGKIYRNKGTVTEEVNCKLATSGIDHETKMVWFRLDPESAAAFSSLAYMDWEVRKQLKHDASKAVQMYSVGHQKGKQHYIKLEDLKKYCGGTGETRRFKQSLLLAFKELDALNVINNPKIYSNNDNIEMVSWGRPA